MKDDPRFGEKSGKFRKTQDLARNQEKSGFRQSRKSRDLVKRLILINEVSGFSQKDLGKHFFFARTPDSGGKLFNTEKLPFPVKTGVFTKNP
jgi:hypothetical protein